MSILFLFQTYYQRNKIFAAINANVHYVLQESKFKSDSKIAKEAIRSLKDKTENKKKKKTVCLKAQKTI